MSETDTVYGPCACSPLGKMIQVSQPYAPGGTPVWTTYTYDALGRTVSVTAPDGVSATSYVYQGNTTKVTDPAGKWKTTTVDVQGNVTQVVEPDPVVESNATCTPGTVSNNMYTCYTYDEMEHLTQVSMPRGSVTQNRYFTYSPTSHLLTSESHPETGMTSYSYMPDYYTFDLLTSKTDAKGQMTTYTYDVYDRVTEIQRSFNFGTVAAPNPVEDGCERLTYTYDAYTDNTTSPAQNFGAWGYVAAVVMGDPAHPQACAAPGYPAQQFTQMFNYTSSGKVVTKRLEMSQAGSSPQTWDVGYTYDTLGRLVSTTYPSSPAVTYTMGYDSVGRPNSLTDSFGARIVQGVSYNAANQPLQTTFGYGLSGSTFAESRTYNQMNQLTGLTNGILGAAQNTTYNFSTGQNNGQITSSVDNGTTISYVYDALKRLTSATATGTNSWNQSYSYDGFGNLTAKNGTGLVFTNVVDQTTNRLGGDCYDNNGNMLGAGASTLCSSQYYVPTYSYDVANRMSSAQVSGGTEYYWYGPDNKRIATFGTRGETIFIYGAMGEKLMDASGNNVYFAGRLIKRGSSALGEDVNFTAVDRLGSVRAALSISGTPTTSTYLPYGEELSSTGNDVIKFATYTRDGSTGLDYADQRYYTSQFGRFMSADRFKRAAKLYDSGSWNKYSYTRGDPVNRVDRQGMEDYCTDEDCCEDGDGCEDNPCDEDPSLCGGGGAPPPKKPKKPSKPTCNNDSPASQFVAANYSAAASLSTQFKIPTDWILGWAASETLYGSSPQALDNGNYYNQTTNNWSGAITCGGGTVSGYACFASFLASATSVLESKYGAAIQADLAANPTMSAALIFQQIANMGFDPPPSSTNAGYGGRVSQVIQGVDNRINCLKLNAPSQ